VKQEKIIGILGGMGSLATAYYFNKLVQAQSGKHDQDYMRVIIDNNTQIPDRTSFLLDKTKNPITALTHSVNILNNAKITHGFMPCFTAHHFYPDLQKIATFEFISVFEVLANYISNNPSIKSIGVLATSGTQKVGLFEKHNPTIKVIYPDDMHQQLVTNAIYDTHHGIKSNTIDHQTIEWLNTASNHLYQQGVDILVAGCTEVSLMKNHPNIKYQWLDPMMLVIDHLVLLK
jgi:aspartate racemase